MNQIITHTPTSTQIDIQDKQVVLLFPNQTTVNFSLSVPDLRCAGLSPTYTYKGWLWCAYINAVHTAGIQLGQERSLALFRKIWRGVKNSRKS